MQRNDGRRTIRGRDAVDDLLITSVVDKYAKLYTSDFFQNSADS